MVLLTAAYIERECARTQSMKSLVKGINKNHLRKITHLYMNDKFIDAIGNFSGCKNLRAIYMQNNCITKIENVDFAINLTHLYLQHNNLMKIENLNGLGNLRSLFLGYNCITIIEGLEGLDNLVELHVENQRIPTGESMAFDPRSMRTMSNSLRILNVSGNKLTSLRPLNNFNLETLDARNNALEDVGDVSETLITLRWLRTLLLHGNLVTQCYRYRENLIAHSSSLVALMLIDTKGLDQIHQIYYSMNEEYLDGKIITDITRKFLKRFKEEKQLRLEKNGPKLSLSDDITTSLNLPPAFRRSVSRAILQQQPGPKLSISTVAVNGGTQSQIFPPWKSTSAIHGKKNDHFTPRPFWRAALKAKKTPRKLSKVIDSTAFPSISKANRG